MWIKYAIIILAFLLPSSAISHNQILVIEENDINRHLPPDGNHGYNVVYVQLKDKYYCLMEGPNGFQWNSEECTENIRLSWWTSTLYDLKEYNNRPQENVLLNQNQLDVQELEATRQYARALCQKLLNAEMNCQVEYFSPFKQKPKR